MLVGSGTGSQFAAGNKRAETMRPNFVEFSEELAGGADTELGVRVPSLALRPLTPSVHGSREDQGFGIRASGLGLGGWGLGTLRIQGQSCAA